MIIGNHCNIPNLSMSKILKYPKSTLTKLANFYSIILLSKYIKSILKLNPMNSIQSKYNNLISIKSCFNLILKIIRLNFLEINHKILHHQPHLIKTLFKSQTSLLNPSKTIKFNLIQQILLKFRVLFPKLFSRDTHNKHNKNQSPIKLSPGE